MDIDNKTVGKIDKGLMILVGIRQDDTKKQVEWMADKIKKLRIFEDEEGKMNLSAKDIGAQYLIVSQFTLYGDCKKGTRPSFTDAAVPAVAIPLYEYFIELMKADGDFVQTGEFGADMLVALENDGPVTMVIDRNNE